jgi:hypothetical protein
VIGDQQRYGMAKTVMSAQAQGVDIGDPVALAAFLNDVQAGRIVLDEGVLGRVLERQLGLPSPAQERKFAQLPVKLPAPGRLVSLTPLGTRAMRQRMLAEGREAGLVGELASASPAELLGTVAQHYTPATAAVEIAIWRAARGGSLDPLVRAIRDCPFLCGRPRC